MNNYDVKLASVRAQLQMSGTAIIGLAKSTSNLFRDRKSSLRPRVDLSGFNQVIGVDKVAGIVVCEAMTTYADILRATITQGVMPCVVPQLKSITMGGAAAGVGIESSSFHYGLVHETLLSIEVLLAGGDVVICSPDNEYSDLFFGFPNSYGTLGYALKATAGVIPVKPYVRLDHIRHSDAKDYFAALAKNCNSDADFLDGSIFSSDEMYITTGRFADSCPYTSDYTFEHIYYRSIQNRETDYLTIQDYIWRWDTDWFWCSKNLLAQNPLVRRLYGRRRLNSITYQKIMRWNARLGIAQKLSQLTGTRKESVIQDIDIPISNAPQFLDFLLREIGILPIWICPIRATEIANRFPLYKLDPGTIYINFGFWDTVIHRHPRSEGYSNRRIERKARELGGIKSLYSDSFFPEDEFWEDYDGAAYARLKKRYDPRGLLRNLYQKCVLRH